MRQPSLLQMRWPKWKTDEKSEKEPLEQIYYSLVKALLRNVSVHLSARFAYWSLNGKVTLGPPT